MLVRISRDEVISTAKMMVSVVARDEVDSEGNSLYSRLVLTSQDEDAVSAVYDVAFSRLIGGVRSVFISSNDLGIELYLDRAKEGFPDSLSRLAQDYLWNYVAGYWLKLKGCSRCEIFLEDAGVSMDGLRRLVFLKDAP